MQSLKWLDHNAFVQVPSIMALSRDHSADRKLNVNLRRVHKRLVLLGSPKALMGTCLLDGGASHMPCCSRN